MQSGWPVSQRNIYHGGQTDRQTDRDWVTHWLNGWLAGSDWWLGAWLTDWHPVNPYYIQHRKNELRSHHNDNCCGEKVLMMCSVYRSSIPRYLQVCIRVPRSTSNLSWYMCTLYMSPVTHHPQSSRVRPHPKPKNTFTETKLSFCADCTGGCHFDHFKSSSPADTWHNSNVIIWSKRRCEVVSTL